MTPKKHTEEGCYLETTKCVTMRIVDMGTQGIVSAMSFMLSTIL